MLRPQSLVCFSHTSLPASLPRLTISPLGELMTLGEQLLDARLPNGRLGG